MQDETRFYAYMESPLGELELCSDGYVLLSVLFVKTQESELKKKEQRQHPVLQETARQLRLYFEKSLQQFSLPVSPAGTDFQRRVWGELMRIPHGKTASYLELSRRLGDEKAIRAAAAANGKNPVAIIIPCHRVIGSSGKLVGYAGDLWRKQWLLEHESNQGQLF